MCTLDRVQIIFIETGRTALLICITKLQYTMLKQGFLIKKDCTFFPTRIKVYNYNLITVTVPLKNQDAPKFKLAAIRDLLLLWPPWALCGDFSEFFWLAFPLVTDLASGPNWLAAWFKSLFLLPADVFSCVPDSLLCSTLSDPVLSLVSCPGSDSFLLFGVFCCLVTLK